MAYVFAGLGIIGVTGYLAYNQGWYDKYVQGKHTQVAKQADQAQKLSQRAAYLRQQASATGDASMYAEANKCEHAANNILIKLKQQGATTQTIQDAKTSQSAQTVKAAQSSAQSSAQSAQTAAKSAQTAAQASGQHPQAVQAAVSATQAASVATQAAKNAQVSTQPTEVAAAAQQAANAATVASQHAQVATTVATQTAAQSQKPAAQQPIAAQQNMVADAPQQGLADNFDIQYPGFAGTEVDFISNFAGSDEQDTRDFQQSQGVPRATQLGNVHQPVDQFLGSYRDFEFYNSGCYPTADAYVYGSDDTAPQGPGALASGLDSATVLKPGLYPEVTSADGFSQITIDGPRNLAWTDNIFDEGTALSRRFNQNYDLRPESAVQMYSPEMLAGFGISQSTQGALASNTVAVRETIA